MLPYAVERYSRFNEAAELLRRKQPLTRCAWSAGRAGFNEAAELLRRKQAQAQGSLRQHHLASMRPPNCFGGNSPRTCRDTARCAALQ